MTRHARRSVSFAVSAPPTKPLCVFHGLNAADQTVRVAAIRAICITKVKKHCLCHCGCNLSSLNAPDVHRFAPNKILENLAFLAFLCRLSAGLVICCHSSSSPEVRLTLGAMTRMLCNSCCFSRAGCQDSMQRALSDVERRRAVAALPPCAQTQNPAAAPQQCHHAFHDPVATLITHCPLCWPPWSTQRTHHCGDPAAPSEPLRPPALAQRDSSSTQGRPQL